MAAGRKGQRVMTFAVLWLIIFGGAFLGAFFYAEKFIFLPYWLRLTIMITLGVVLFLLAVANKGLLVAL